MNRFCLYYILQIITFFFCGSVFTMGSKDFISEETKLDLLDTLNKLPQELNLIVNDCYLNLHIKENHFSYVNEDYVSTYLNQEIDSGYIGFYEGRKAQYERMNLKDPWGTFLSSINGNIPKIGPNKNGLMGLLLDNRWKFIDVKQELESQSLKKKQKNCQATLEMEQNRKKVWYCRFFDFFIYLINLCRTISCIQLQGNTGVIDVASTSPIQSDLNSFKFLYECNHGESIICLHPLKNKFIIHNQSLFLLTEEDPKNKQYKSFILKKKQNDREKLFFLPGDDSHYLLTKEEDGLFCCSVWDSKKESQLFQLIHSQQIQINFSQNCLLMRSLPSFVGLALVDPKNAWNYRLYSLEQKKLLGIKIKDSNHMTSLYCFKSKEKLNSNNFHDRTFTHEFYGPQQLLFDTRFQDCLLYPEYLSNSGRKNECVFSFIHFPKLDTHKRNMHSLIAIASRLLDQDDCSPIEWLNLTMEVFKRFKDPLFIDNKWKACWYAQESKTIEGKTDYSTNLFKKLDQKKEVLLETIITDTAQKYNKNFKENIYALITDKDNSLFLNPRYRKKYYNKVFMQR